jgi:hypothetical protein
VIEELLGMANRNAGATTPEAVDQYQTMQPLLAAMLEELRKLAVKKPEVTLSKQKVVLINRLLGDLKNLLANEPESKYLDLLTDDTLPQYSDAVLVISQYGAALESFYNRHCPDADEFGLHRAWDDEDGE